MHPQREMKSKADETQHLHHTKRPCQLKQLSEELDVKEATDSNKMASLQTFRLAHIAI